MSFIVVFNESSIKALNEWLKTGKTKKSIFVVFWCNKLIFCFVCFCKYLARKVSLCLWLNGAQGLAKKRRLQTEKWTTSVLAKNHNEYSDSTLALLERDNRAFYYFVYKSCLFVSRFFHISRYEPRPLAFNVNSKRRDPST